MMKLLIVEDNQPMRRLIRSLAADLSESITECSDGADARANYAEHHPDWVLMDLMMPQMDGLAATRQILAANRRPGSSSSRTTRAGSCARPP